MACNSQLVICPYLLFVYPSPKDARAVNNRQEYDNTGKGSEVFLIAAPFKFPESEGKEFIRECLPREKDDTPGNTDHCKDEG